jgi:hypothetical protein
MRPALFYTVCTVGYLAGLSGCGTLSEVIWACKRAEVTAVSLNPCDGKLFGHETGIPFYLPKPLLIIAKNFRNIEEARTGLTDSAPIPNGFDDQSKYADLNARTNFAGLQPGTNGVTSTGDVSVQTNLGNASVSPARVHFPGPGPIPGAAVTPETTPSDGLSPGTFFTYHIVFVPDMTRKYGLKIRGGPGEIRAAMNLVNGWQFTGIGPFYMKDSATAQNALASGISTRLGGEAAADVINATANLGKLFGKTQDASVPANEPNLQRIIKAMGDLPLNRVPMTLPKFAQIHVYEAHAELGSMEWREIAGFCFDRDYLGTEQVIREYAPPPTPPAPPKGGGTSGASVPGSTQGAVVGVDPSVARTAVAGIFGLPLAGSLQASTTPTVAPAPVVPGGVTQIQVGAPAQPAVNKEWNLFKFGAGHGSLPRPTIQNRTLTSVDGILGTEGTSGTGLVPPGTGGGAAGGTNLNAGNVPGAAVINQPIISHLANTPMVPSRPMETPPADLPK